MKLDGRQEQTPRTSSEPNPIVLAWMAGLTVVAFCFAGMSVRSAPGGPFFSVMGDIVPALAALIAIRLALFNLRVNNTGIRLIAFGFLVLATLVLSSITNDVYSFWYRPSARGVLIGF